MKATSLFRFLLIGLVVSVVISTPAAFADVISFTLNTPNAAIAGFTGPYVNVDVNRADLTHATLTFTSLNSAGGILTYAMGSTGLVGASVNSTNFTVTGITENGTGTASIDNPPGTSNISTFGLFNAALTMTDGFPDRATSVSFLLTNISGTWAAATNVLAPNAAGFRAVSHIFVSNGPNGTQCGTDACATGFAGGTGTTTAVPEPSSLLLLGTTIIAAGIGIRRKMSR